jgi:hypothetical protein
MVQLKATFPDNLRGRETAATVDFPCRFYRKAGKTWLILAPPMIEVEGVVTGIDAHELEIRAPSLVGTDISHDLMALVTLGAGAGDVYPILSLSLFYPGLGWLSVLEKGAYVDFDMEARFNPD